MCSAAAVRYTACVVPALQLNDMQETQCNFANCNMF